MPASAATDEELRIAWEARNHAAAHVTKVARDYMQNPTPEGRKAVTEARKAAEDAERAYAMLYHSRVVF